MFGILFSALNTVLAFLVRSVIAKFFLFFGLFIFISEAINYLTTKGLFNLNLNGVFSNIPETLWFFLDLCKFSYGFPIIITAYVTRFIIRRLPIIG